MTKKLREQVKAKFNGLCAYTGKPLDEKWQVDHITPKHYWLWHQPWNNKKVDDIENLLPAIRIINHYKRCQTLEQFRNYINSLHQRLAKLPKNTRIEKSQKRKEYLLQVAALFDITPDKPFSGLFYFETLPVCKE